MARSITVDQAAEEMSVTADTIRNLLERGDLRGHRVGRAIRVYVDSLEDYQRRNELTPKAPRVRRNIRKTNNTDLQAARLLDSLGV